MNSDRATSTEQPVGRVSDPPSAHQEPERAGRRPARPQAAWLLGLLQAGDSFYPTGSYAHSFGLEGLVQEGVVRDRATLREFVFRSVLPALRQVELPIAVHAWEALGAGDWDRLREICVLASALKAPREARLASENIGRQRVELVAALRGSSLAREFLARADAAKWPCAAAVAAAVEGRVTGAPRAAMLAGLAYATLAAVLAAAMKLLRLGQNACQALLTEALGTVPAMIATAERCPPDEIGWFNPWLDIAAARHETADARMFIS
ncbi:MAG TPA: urease accessory UreF family protein [Opitutus sp.]|nr:urease accessory UreF family protein [Opitutus sp.]